MTQPLSGGGEVGPARQSQAAAARPRRRDANGRQAPQAPEWKGVETSLGSQIKQTQRLLNRVLARHLAEHAVPIGMWDFLRVLWEEEGLSQGEVGRRVGATPAAATEQLRNMEASGLIERRASDSDGRQKDIHLTARGRAMEAALGDFPTRIETHALAGLSPGEIGFLRLCLGQIRRNLAAYEGSADSDGGGE